MGCQARYGEVSGSPTCEFLSLQLNPSPVSALTKTLAQNREKKYFV
jgi:hypothetical protein